LKSLNAESVKDLTSLSDSSLLEHLEKLTHLTLIDFARDSLKPTALAALAQGKLEARLKKVLRAERSQAALGELIMGVHPDPEADLPAALQQISEGELSKDSFLDRFGHRASQEMELAQPRWSEDPAALDRLIPKAVSPVSAGPSNPQSERADALERVVQDAKLNGSQRAELENDVRLLHIYLGLRETAKHYLLKGYAEVRKVLLELDRRHHLNSGIFYLTPAELPRLAHGEDVTGMIAERRRRRTLALSLEVPQVLFSDDLDAVGRPIVIEGADTLQGVPLSAGVAEAPALVLHEPDSSAIPSEPYILVCPSTDPAWVPLFVQARGLVMETGGVLSHGAIVAREFGLPAVAGLPDVLKRIKTGQRVRVDGALGTVTFLP
jgi:rifampicin phosphotransferase